MITLACGEPPDGYAEFVGRMENLLALNTQPEHPKRPLVWLLRMIGDSLPPMFVSK